MYSASPPPPPPTSVPKIEGFFLGEGRLYTGLVAHTRLGSLGKSPLPRGILILKGEWEVGALPNYSKNRSAMRTYAAYEKVIKYSSADNQVKSYFKKLMQYTTYYDNKKNCTDFS